MADRTPQTTPPVEYGVLVEYPDSKAMHQAGYAYVYIDQDWYYSLDQQGKDALKQGNYETVAVTGDEDDFRILLRVCSETEQCAVNYDAFPKDTTQVENEIQSSSL